MVRPLLLLAERRRSGRAPRLSGGRITRTPLPTAHHRSGCEFRFCGGWIARTLLLALAAALLHGCVQVRHHELGLPLDEAQVPDPARRVTLAQVMAGLGPPLRLSAAPHGYVMAWEHWHITERKLGFSLGALGADFVSADWGRADVRGDFLLLTFDRQHRLLTAHLERWQGDGGGGQGLQAFASVVDVVDVGDLLQPLPAHSWGFDSLQRLPVALNRASRPDTGQNGIEQRGTGRGVGQNALGRE